jgi:CubicO group peptidase (beta-lactamase class C family)
MRQILCILFAVFLNPFCLAGELNIGEIDSLVEDALRLYEIPGAAVGVIVNGEVILAKGYGHRDQKNELPITEETLFGIGSTTKAFTACILGQLVDKGILRWDDPVIKYIPQFRLWDESLTRQVTIRDLLAHRTGVAAHDGLWFCREIDRQQVMDSLQYLEPSSGLREQFYYSNIMYTVAGTVIERVTGLSWEENIRARIFWPLGMERSNTSIEDMQLLHNVSKPYALIYGKTVEIPYHSIYPVAPGGAVNSTLNDLLAWVRMQLGNKPLIQKDTLHEMHDLHMPISHEKTGLARQEGYGLGWFVGSYRDWKEVRHGGCVDGFFSEVTLLPEKNLGIVILCNSSSDGVHFNTLISHTIMDQLLGSADVDWIAHVSALREKQKQDLMPVEFEEGICPTNPSSKLTGHFEHPSYGSLYICQNEQEGLVAIFGNEVIPLKPIQMNLYKGIVCLFLKFGSLRILDFSFNYDDLGNVSDVSVNFEPNSKPLIFNKTLVKNEMASDFLVFTK